MSKTKSIQDGSIGAVVIIIIIVVIVGILGIIYWSNFVKGDADKQAAKDTSQTQSQPCKEEESTKATDGVFCSEAMGFELPVPGIFKGKLTRAENYEVYQGSLDPSDKTTAGMSENVYEAKVEGESDRITLAIAQEPLRSGYIGIHHLLRPAYFDMNTEMLNLVNTPTSQYDAATETYTTTGSYSSGDPVPSQTIDNVRLYRGQSGDAGKSSVEYAGMVKGKIVKIILKYEANPMFEPEDLSVDFSELTKDFDENVKDLKKI